MKYSDVYLDNNFVGNMRGTSWTALFPRWYMEDSFIKAIGKEIEYIKSKALFKLLNIGVKPPVMLWQTSITHKKYTIKKTIETFEDNELYNKIKTNAPLYKTWGTIQIINRGDELNNLKLFFNDEDGISINEFIDKDDVIFIDIENQKFYLNDNEIDVITYGQGMPYFITSKNNETYQKDTPLHNEALCIAFFSNDIVEDVKLETEVILNNAVFTDEQNIEITSLELLPIEKVVLYAHYDFPYNKKYNGIKKVYVKEYQSNTNVVADMITTQFYTKKFYVEVYFKDIEHPYTVGFPAYKNADPSSAYHVNTELDALGETLELQRREYKTNIPEEDYPFTFPEYYPFDIEQDYWYYQRLVNEYAWNDNAINRVDVKDTEDNTVMRLHSINPFVEDFVVYTNSKYPQDIEGVNYNEYLPSFIYQDTEDNKNTQMAFQDTHHLLKNDDNFSYITLHSKSENYITYEGYKSKEMGLYFDLSDIPENVNIDGLEIIIDTESTDNSVEKYNDNRTRLQIADNEALPGSIGESGYYELKRKNIVYGSKKTLFGLNNIQKTNNYVEQKIVIGKFSAESGKEFQIPFEYYEDYDLDKHIDDQGHEIIDDKFHEIDYDDIIIDGLQDAMIFFYTTNGEQKECVGTTTATYHKSIENDKVYRYLLADEFPEEEVSSMNIISTEGNKHPFNIEIPVEFEKHNNVIHSTIHPKFVEPKGYEGDLSYLLRNYGLYFMYALSNDSTSNSSSILLHNIFLRVYYSPKKEKLSLYTNFVPTKETDDEFTLGYLHVRVENIGEKPYQSDVDIICPDNLILSRYHIPIDLNVNDICEETIKVAYNIAGDVTPIDGKYDIITICDDLERTNSVKVKTTGESYTNTMVDSQLCFIDRDTTITAYVNNINNEPINEGQVEFRINGYRIGNGDVDVINGEASITFRPINYEFIRAGTNDLQVIYSGSIRYNMSRGYATLWMNKNKTKIELDIPDILVQRFDNKATIRVTYADEYGEYQPMQEGNVSLFLGDEEMFTMTLKDGIAETYFQPTYNTGKVIAKAIYSGTDIYPGAEIEKEVMVIGGKIKIVTPDIQARPNQQITLKTYVYDAHDNKYPYGFIDYIIKYEDTIIYEYKNAIVYDGQAEHQYRIPRDAISLFDENDTTQYDLIASYHSEIDGDIETDSYSHIDVAREEVQLIHHAINFNYSNKEPLGFYIEVLNKDTGYSVTDGLITISIPSLGITIQEPVNDDGTLKTIYSPLEFSAIQWNELFHSSFKFENNPLYDSLTDAMKIKYGAKYIDSDLIFTNDLYPDDGAPKVIDFRIDDNNVLWFNNKETEEMEYIYSKETNDGGLHVYIRTSEDENVKRYFDEGNHNINITYTSDYQYKKANIKTTININDSEKNIDIPQYNLQYGNNSEIVGYVTEYEEQLVQINNSGEVINADELLNEGQVNYYIDGNLVYCSNVVNSTAVLPSGNILSTPSGKHLLMGEYFYQNQPKTYSYTFMNIEKIPSTISPHKYTPNLFNKIFPGKKSKLSAKIDVNTDIEITGHVNLYLNDTQVGYVFLTGEEDGEVFIEFNVPENLQALDYKYKLVYSGDDKIKGYSLQGTLKSTKLPIEITGDIGPIYATPNTECDLIFKVNTIAEEENDDITQGKIALIPFEYGENDYKHGKLANVINNTATINLTIPNNIDEEPYKYYLKYIDGVNYEQEEPLTFLLYVIEGYDEVIVDGTNRAGHAETLKTGLWAVKNNGKIKISSWKFYKSDTEYNASGLLDNSFKITKDVTITGDVVQEEEQTDEYYARNIYPSIESNIEELKYINVKIHDRGDFEEEEFNKLHLVDIQNSQINVNEFKIIDEELYYIQDDTSLMPIYLFSDGLYYAEKEIKPRNTVLNINKHNVKFENIRFKNGDWYNNFIIQNNGTLEIKHCIIGEKVVIQSSNNLICNENLIYGEVRASQTYDIDNNWWGQNKSPIPTNNNIILKMEAEQYPPVVGELIDIRLQLIGENGNHYNLPQVAFKIYAETGNVNIENGYLVNSQIVTSYDDAIQKGKVFAEVDNQKVSIDIYDYDAKTETILETPKVVPLGYQITLRAIIQSVADKFYTFDKDNQIVKQSNSINNGTVTFYINNSRVGTVGVKNGKAELPFYTSSFYHDGDDFTLNAVYEPTEYYFSSKAQTNIKFIDENAINNIHIIYVSPNVSNGDGTYGKPFNNITDALAQREDGHTYKIYLKEGIYHDTGIDITNYNVELYKFDGDVIFSDIENTIAVINDNGHLTIKGIDFVDNKTHHLFTNNNELDIEDCIFYKNNILVNNVNNKHTNITKCAIVDNNNIVTDYNKLNTTKCWFGTNTPAELGFSDANTSYVPDDYILMDLKSSKTDKDGHELIYIGTIAHIIASLNKRYVRGVKQDYTESLPLRVALFSTSFGSLMPLRDYTHNKIAISLLNTTEAVNSDRIIITAGDNTNYYQGLLKLQVFVENTTAKNLINNDNIKFQVTQKGKDIIPIQDVEIINGVATLISDIYKLDVGEYTLQCTYKTENNIYNSAFNFDVKLPSLSFSNINIDNGDHFYNLMFEADVHSSINDEINNLPVKCYIDNKNIGQYTINNNHLSLNLKYSSINAGTHKLKIETIDFSKYQPFIYEDTFTSSEKATYIEFDEQGLPQNTTRNLEAYVYDDNHKIVNEGKIIVAIDNKIITDDEGNAQEFKLNNGKAIIAMKEPLINGQHLVTITYTGVPKRYKSDIKVFNLAVGLYPVVIANLNEDTFRIEYGDILSLNLLINDSFGKKVTKGKIYFDIDDVCLNIDSPTEINNGIATNDLNTRRINIGTHDLSIRYIDDTYTYADTTFSYRLVVNQIKTKISIDTITATPDTTVEIDYDVSSKFNVATSGILRAFLNGREIGTEAVTSNIRKRMSLSIPYYPTGDYQIDFTYHDNEFSFADASLTVPLVIKRGDVKISNSYTAYYPKEEFDFDMDILDIEGDNINEGFLSIYVDGVLTYDDVIVSFGKASVPLTLNQVKQYKISVKYKQNEYYKETLYEQTIDTNKISVQNISIEEPLESFAGAEELYHILFTTLKDHKVSDGVVDFIFDGNLIASQYIQEQNKEFKLNIPIVPHGIHTLLLKYHDSNMFNDFVSDPFEFIIKPEPITLTLDDATAELNNEVMLNAHIDPITTGIIKFYIAPGINEAYNETNLKLIGIEQIDNRDTIPHIYKIPVLYNENEFTIKAEFRNNDKYEDKDAFAVLRIQEMETSIALNDIDAQYQDNIEFYGTTNIRGTEPIDLYIGNNNIGQVMSQDGEIKFKYRLGRQYKAGTYTIKAKYLGSKIIKPTEDIATLNISKYTPTLKTKEYDVYIGAKLILDNIIVGNRDINLDYGTLIEKIDEETIPNTIINTPTVITPTKKTGFDINVQFTPLVNNEHEDNEYNGFYETITVNMHKNPVDIKVYTVPPTARGDSVRIYINMTCDTTPLDVNLTALVNNTQVEIVNGEGYYDYTLPMLSNENNQFILPISISEDDDTFVARENTTTSFSVPYINRDKIYVRGNTDGIGTKDSPVSTLSKALELIATNGTIYIQKDINENVDIDKIISINGYTDENNSQITGKININKKCNLSNLIFNNNENNPIKCYAEININKCTFNNAPIIFYDKFNINESELYNNLQSAITVSNKNKEGNVQYCTFYNNHATNGAAIYNYKGDNLNIEYNTFYNNISDNHGASLYLNGDSLIRHNSFYNNQGIDDVYVIAGGIESEFNVFDNNICNISNYAGYVVANMTYWGWNDIDDVDTTYNNNENGTLIVESWLKSDYHINPELQLSLTQYDITPLINKYRANRDDQEDIMIMEPVEWKFPAYVNGHPVYINNTIENGDNEITLTIGKEEIIIK